MLTRPIRESSQGLGETLNSVEPNHFSQELYPLLHRVQQDGGIHELTFAELAPLARELRRSLIDIVQATGGHLASNLGVVELTIALHYVFQSPKDAFLWDVGHQSYVHKMLTGRWLDFAQLRQRGGLSGFPRRDESPHDYLNSGHAGTAISAGLGLEFGRSLASHSQLAMRGKVLCVVGDASLTSGMAFEAMNHCGHVPNQLVVVMNDNEMSISPNVGAVSRILSRLTAGHSYVFIRDHINQLIRSIPWLGGPAYQALLRLKGAVKKAFYRNNLFTEFGFKYIGPIDGHNIKMLLDTFERIALLKEPVFLHVRTQKGKGLKEAEEAPAQYHGVSPQVPTRHLGGIVPPDGKQQTFTQSFTAALMALEHRYTDLVCISAAMSSSTGLKPFADRYPQRFFDVGIAEQHAVTLACGLALAGKQPLIAIYSTFMQRAFDQLIHDVVLMQLPLVFICDRAGIVPGDGDTHQGIYDIAMFRSIIGLELYSPATQQQLQACLAMVLERSHQDILCWKQVSQTYGPVRTVMDNPQLQSLPTVIRIPKRNCPNIAPSGVQPELGPIRGAGQAELWQLQFFAAKPNSEASDSGAMAPESRALLFCTGSLLLEALELQQRLAAEQLALDVLQLCQLSPLPSCLEDYLTLGYRGMFCIEDGVQQGGVGEALQCLSMSLSLSKPISARSVACKIPQLGTYQELLQDYGLDVVSLEAWVKPILI